MAPWLLLLLPWSVLALEISGKATNSGDMDAILNQLAISMQREMENTDDSQHKEELPQEGQYHPSTVILDNWIRVIKKEMEKIGLMQKPGFESDQKRAGKLATRIIKKRGEEKEEDREIKMLKRSFWMWERSLNRKAQAKPAWFVLPGATGENPEEDMEKGTGDSLERKERDVMATSSENEKKEMQRGSGGRMPYNPMKSFWKWERALNSRPNLSNTAWFVVDQEEGKQEEARRERDEMRSNKRGGSVVKSFQRWGNPLQQSLTIRSGQKITA